MQIVGTYRDKGTVRAYPELLGLAANAIHQGCDFLGSVATQMEVLNAQIGQFFTPYDVARMMAMISLEGAADLIAAHGFLREALARETKREARALVFELGPNGKPQIQDNSLHFSLTHTGEHALVAVSELELGLDAEEIRSSRVDGPLAERVMTAEEFKTWSRAAREDQVHAFFRLWSAKESVMKATGLGMDLAPRSFAVLAPNALELCNSVSIENRAWTMRALTSSPEFSLALATQGAAQVTQIAGP